MQACSSPPKPAGQALPGKAKAHPPFSPMSPSRLARRGTPPFQRSPFSLC